MIKSHAIFSLKTYSLHILWLGYLCIATLNIGAQEAQFAFRHYTTDQGLPSPEVYEILQDKEGYVWFSTDNGVSRFDGYTFENFGAAQGLRNNVIFHMQEDWKGRIWMSTLSGNVYYYYRDSIYAYTFNDKIKEVKKNTYLINQFYVDSTETLHLAFLGLGILKIDSLGNTDLLNVELPCGAIIYKIEDRTLNNYIYYNKDQWDQCNPLELDVGFFPLTFYENGTIHTVRLPHQEAPSLKEYGFGFELNQESIFYTISSKLYLIKNHQLNWVGAYPAKINSFFKDETGAIFLGCNEKNGLRWYHNIDDIVEEEYNELLKNFTVSHILQDRSGGYWFSTIENGVFYAPNRDFQIYNTTSGLTTNIVTAITLKNEHELFIGLKDGAVFHLNTLEGSLQQLPRHPKDIEIYELHYDSQHNRLWKGSTKLQYLEDNKWRILKKQNGDEARNRGNKELFIDAENQTLWGCNGGFNGISKVDLTTNEMIDLAVTTRGRTFTIFKDFEGHIYLGRVDGLFEYKEGSVQQIAFDIEGLQSRVEDIDQMSDSTLVFATKGSGLILLYKDGSHLQIDAKKGLASDMIENIHIDHKQQIWSGTLNGLNKIVLHAPDDFKITTYKLPNGLPSNEINDITSYKDQIWVATTNGLVKIPGEMELQAEMAAPKFAAVRVNGLSFNPDSVSSFPYHRNHFQLSFLSNNFKMDGQIPYRYRFLASDEWSYTYNRTVNYTILVPGTYFFEVQCQNESGQWSESLSWEFHITAPFWRQFWFWLALSLLLTLIVWVYSQSRIRRVRAAAAMEREISSLKQAALKAQINPHFIFNCLNSIQNAILEGDKLQGATHLAQVSKLIRMVLNAMSKERIPLRDELQILKNYLELEQMRAKGNFQFEIKTGEGIQPDKLFVPPMLAQPYIENAILHGMQDARGFGKVEIVFRKEADFFIIEIIDNGIGITEARRRKEGQHVLHESVGMSIPKKQLELLEPQAKHKMIQIEERVLPDGSIGGTHVLLRISWSKVFEYAQEFHT